MIRATFVHAEGAGPVMEQRLWNCGASSWAAFLALRRMGRLRGERMTRIARMAWLSERALARKEAGFFSKRLRPRDRWRLLDGFREDAAYVDVETTGLDRHRHQVTVIGLYANSRFRVYVRGRDLDEFVPAISRSSLIVTYGGASFDAPFLRQQFPGVELPPCVDLRYPLARLGYTGGLKAVETAVGIVRPEHVRNLDGFDAVRLWEAYEAGDRQSLDRLIAYTKQDVENLAPLAQIVRDRMPETVGFPALAGNT